MINIKAHPSQSRATNVARFQTLLDLYSPEYHITQSDIYEDCDIRVLFSIDKLPLPVNQDKLVLDISDHVMTTPAYYPLVDKVYRKLLVGPRLKRSFRKLDAIIVASIEQYKFYSDYVPLVFIRHDKSIYHQSYKEAKLNPHQCVFVWDGQGIHYPLIHQLLSDHKKFFSRKDVIIKIVSDKLNLINKKKTEHELKKLEVNYIFKEWSPNTYIKNIQVAHCGLAPLNLKCIHSKSKPNNKLINYQGLALPVICSKSTDYVAFASESPGIIKCVGSAQGWNSALYTILSLFKKNLTLDLNGRNFILNKYQKSYYDKSWIRVFNEVLS